MSTNYLALANYSFPTVNASSITVGSSINMNQAAFSTLTGSTITVSTLTGSTLNAGRITVSTIAFQSTTIALGQSTSQTNNFTNGSFTAWASTLSTTASTAGAGLARVQRVTMSQSGQYQLAVQSSVASYSVVKSSDSGVTWQTLTNGANGLPAGSPAYTSISYSATGQYALAAVNEGGLYVSNNATATPTFTSITFAPYAYLPFDNSVADVIGNANPIATGSPAYVTGQVGNAINLANTMGSTATKYIRGTWSGSNNFTVSGRFNAQTVTAGQYGIIFSALGTGITLYITNTAALVFFIGSSPTAGLGTGSNYVTANTWYSFTIIYQLGGTSSIYINGTLIGSVSNTGAVTNAYARSNQFGLGTYDNSLGNAFNGYIDDFRIYNYATTATNFSHTAVSATGQYMLAAAAGGGLFQSTNYGQTWTQVNAVLNGGVWTSLSQSESGQYALATTSAASIQPNLTGLAVATWSTNGVSWAVSQSSRLDGFYPGYNAFQTSPNAYGWTPLSNTYTTSGNSSGVYTTIQGGIGSIQGDWVQLQSSVPLVMSSYQLGSAGGAVGQFPKTFYILGSNDGVTWNPIQLGTINANPNATATTLVPGTIQIGTAGVQPIGASTYITTTTYSPSTTAYIYFRMLITTNFLGSAGYFQLGQWTINFVGGLTCTSNYGQTWSNAANPLFLDSSAISGDGQYTLGVCNQSSSTLGYLPLDNSTAATGSGLTYSSTAGTVPFTTTARVGTHSANLSANTAGGASANYLNYTVSSALSFPSVFTMAAWIYPTALPASNAACAVALNNNTSSPGGPFIGINPTDNLIRFGVNATGGNTNTYSLAAATINTWYHVVGVCLNGTATLYVNGVYQGVTGYSGTPSINGGGIITNLFVGANATGAGGNSFAGYVDDVRIYTTALTASAVSLLYATPTLNPIPNSSTYLGNNYLTSLSSSSYTPITLPNINANISGAACSNTGQYMVVVTQGSTNNVYYSTNYGSTWTALTVGSSAMTSCVMSVDGTYITVSNATNVYTLNWNGQGFTLAIGSQAGAVNQASNAIAIGNQAGISNQTANSIVLNASGAAVNPYTQGFYVAPIQPAISSLARTFPLLGYGSDNQIVQSATSFSNSQQTVYGEWIQYQLATASPITSYTLQGRTSVASRYPASWIVVGSNDGTNWTLLDTQTGTSGWGTYTLAQPSAPYTYYRMIITQIPSAAGYVVDIGAFILNNGSPLFGASANYTVVASGNYNVLQQNSVTVCTTTFSWPNTIAVNSLGVSADGGANATYQPGWIPTMDGYTRTSNYFLGFFVTGFGLQYEYNASGIAFQGTSTTINTTVLGNTNMAGTLCLMGGSRVGIGSTIPQYALDVAGTAQLNGTIPAYGQPDSAAVVPNSTFGQTWTALSGLPLTNWQGCAVSATGQYMTVVSQSGTVANNIYYSSNYGQSWSAATGFLANANYSGVSMSSSGQYQLATIATASSVFYVSSNYGVTWTSGVTTGSWGRSCISSTGQYQYVTSTTGTGGVYYSNNYGLSFTQVIPLASSAWIGICCSASGQYVSVGSSASVIYYSTNYGISYTAATSVSGYFMSLASSASGQYQVGTEYIGNYVYYSNNYGASWTLSNAPFSTGWYGCASSASGQYMMACSANTGGVLYFSTNYGVSWFASGAPSIDYRSIAMSQNGLYTIAVNNSVGGGATGRVYLSTLANVGLITNGRVGIGVTNPESALTVYGSNIGAIVPTLVGQWKAQHAIYATSAYCLKLGAHYTGGVGAYSSIQSTEFYSGTEHPGNLTLQPIGGNVGIGLTNPSVPLHVTGSAIVTSSAYSYFAPNSGIAASAVGPGTFGATIYVVGGIVSTQSIACVTFSSFSDVRIKKNIETYPSNVLELLLQFRIVSYDHIDFKNGHVKAGLVAQEVEQIAPSCVNKKKEYIPNIYSLGKHYLDGDNVVITVVDANGVPKDVSGVEIGASRKISLKLLKNGTTEHDVNEEIIAHTSTQFTVRKWDNYCADDKVFVYGTEIDDFRVLDKDVIAMMGIRGIQELAKQATSSASQIQELAGQTAQLTTSQSAISQTVQELASQTAQLAAENTQLKSTIAAQASSIAALEARLSAAGL